MKFVCVKKAPDSLRKGEHVIEFPNFLDEVKKNEGKAPRSKLTGNTQLRHIIGEIGLNYAPETFSPYADVRINRFEGIPFESNEDLSKIIVELLATEFPQMFVYYLEKKINERPPGTELIYFVGDFVHSAPFTAAGFEYIKEKDIDVALGLKQKKTIGKPAVKDND